MTPAAPETSPSLTRLSPRVSFAQRCLISDISEDVGPAEVTTNVHATPFLVLVQGRLAGFQDENSGCVWDPAHRTKETIGALKGKTERVTESIQSARVTSSK
jgi:hypothetical protein